MAQYSVDDPQRPQRRRQQFQALAVASLSTSVLFTSILFTHDPKDFAMRVSLFAFLTAIVLVGLAYWWGDIEADSSGYPQIVLLLGAATTFGGVAAALCHFDVEFGGYFFILGAVAVLILLFARSQRAAATARSAR